MSNLLLLTLFWGSHLPFSPSDNYYREGSLVATQIQFWVKGF